MTARKELAIRLSPADNVVVARLDLLRGSELAGEGVVLRDHVPSGHKVATNPIASGQPVLKYNQIIGFACAEIKPGDHVHVHNCAMGDFQRDYAYCSRVTPVDAVPEAERATFQGYRRADGRVGTRNYIGVLTSVNCSATVARYVAEAFERTDLLDAYPNVDGVVPFVHSTGCGMADSGDGYEALQRTLWGYARHPNLAGVLMLGLGCEVNQIPTLMEAYGLKDNDTFHHLTIQQAGGTRRTIKAAIERITAMLPAAK